VYVSAYQRQKRRKLQNVIQRTAISTLGDLEVRLELAVGLERTRLVGRVAVDDVGLVVLEVTEREEDDVALGDPDLWSQ
jgi:hypothetical protein